MTDQPPKTKILTRLRIDEVSAVNRGAGEGVKIVLMKRNDPQSHNSDEIAKATAALAESVGSIIDDCDDDQAAALAKAFEKAQANLTKSFAAVLAGDEADRQDAATPAHDLIGAHHHASQVADLLVESGSHGSREEALQHLLHTARGQALLSRMSKHHEEAPMPINLSDIVKVYGVTSLAKYMVEQNSSFGATEHELVELATQDASRKYPGSTPAMAFAKLYEESAVLRDAIEIAKSAAFEDAMTAEIEKDSRAAIDELTKIGKAKWPGLTRAQQFARAFETNPSLAARAHRRPGPSTSFAHPVAKDLAAPVVDPKPTFVGDDVALDVDDPRDAVEQLKEQGRSRWPSASALEQFERALTDPENSELVRRAFARPTGSSPPRR